MGFLKKKRSIVAIDIGGGSIKLMEVDSRGPRPYLLNATITPISSTVFANNQITKKEAVAEKISAALLGRDKESVAMVVAMPAPTVFTKKLTMAEMDPRELLTTIKFEASSYIPQGVDTVKLDYSIVNRKPNGEIEVLVVAVKNEIVESFIDTITLAGYDTAIVDVDYFALQNAFELAYPHLLSKPVCLVHIGSRYSFINICKGGVSLFTGNITLGGMSITQEIAKALGIDAVEAEKLKQAYDPEDKSNDPKLGDVITKARKALVSDLDRQIRIMWNASGAEEDISNIFLSGGGSLLNSLDTDLTNLAGVSCELMDPFHGFEIGGEFDRNYIKKLSPSMTIAAGLAMRRSGDKAKGTVAA